MKPLRRLLFYLRPYWAEALIAPVLMVLEVAMDLTQPRLLQTIVDIGIARHDMVLVLRTGLFMVGVVLMGVFGGIGCGVFAVRSAQKMGTDLRGALFRKVQTLAFPDLDRLQTGHLVTVLTNDVVQVQELVMMVLRIMVRAPLTLVGSLILAVVTSPRLALLLLIMIPLLTLILVAVVRKAHPLFTKMQKRLDGLDTVMQENLAGVRLVKAFVRQSHETARFGEANDALMNQTVSAMNLIALVMPLNMLILQLGIVVTLWLGGAQVKMGFVTVGQIMAFINYLLSALMSLLMVGMVLARVSRAMASAERIREVLASKPKIRDRRRTRRIDHPTGRVVFDNVSFSYGGDNHQALRQVSFTAEPGQTVAILGSTGSGKSTLIHLIPRFYKASSGTVSLDGVDVREMKEEELRRLVAVALQEAILFSGTIADNIRYGRRSASEQEVLEAAQAAQADEFIRQFPDGYKTIIGQRGVNLSGGQKQRLAIARALLMNPRILILDDCTSAVDVKTEARIQEALAERVTATTFIVAQRISTVLAADNILVLEEGRLTGQGKHGKLLRSNEIYREIYDSQLGGGRMNRE